MTIAMKPTTVMTKEKYNGNHGQGYASYLESSYSYGGA